MASRCPGTARVRTGWLGVKSANAVSSVQNALVPAQPANPFMPPRLPKCQVPPPPRAAQESGALPAGPQGSTAPTEETPIVHSPTREHFGPPSASSDPTTGSASCTPLSPNLLTWLSHFHNHSLYICALLFSFHFLYMKCLYQTHFLGIPKGCILDTAQSN